MSVEEAYTDADSKQITVEGSYMPPVELLKAARTGLSDFASCTCGHMLLTLALSGFKVHRPPGSVGMLMADLWQGRPVWE